MLDLLGAPHPRIRSYFVDTAWLFDAMASAEQRLASSGAFVYGADGAETLQQWGSYFAPRKGNDVNFGFIEDDHLPFLRLGVSVLHVIASPFPPVWHTLKVRDASSGWEHDLIDSFDRIMLLHWMCLQCVGGT